MGIVTNNNFHFCHITKKNLNFVSYTSPSFGIYTFITPRPPP